ncbi:DNA-binding protein [Staphylococcus edaphicus]|uniref:DNA-binding protein n=1 Tax=Staphylococcus edaphicus TaxID=1955013 RepID=A0A2C6U6Y9_9STAP|nr:DNA-binding protein [Staphylococcus edaphicus]PHK49592.1 DNA-binding protein [Staphylococcus edaphicus]UQW82024.1 DNA-binding protein [Staphylococcus edaphicus]
MTTDLPKIGKPATNALHNIGVKSLEDVAKYDRTTLLGIHGVGPKAIDILEDTLKKNDMQFKSDYEFDVLFNLTGDLKCDNAPKRRAMLEFLIASASVDKDKLQAMVAEDFKWNVAGAFELDGFETYYQELEAHITTIESIDVKDNISHGKYGALHGTQILKDGTTIYFADMFEFESHRKDAKVKSITSYIIMDEGES